MDYSSVSGDRFVLLDLVETVLRYSYRNRHDKPNPARPRSFSILAIVTLPAKLGLLD